MIFYGVGTNFINNVIMVINREFFFRGWLPAGLLINARLISSSSEHGETVLRPVLNASPESSWPSQQPPIVFPVSQATDSKAILLKDAVSEGTLVMLPLGDWYGPGTPFILAINTWYEGRIQEVSGEDVMAVRISKAFTLSYYSYYSGVATPDVRLATLPCKWIQGVASEKRAFKDDSHQLTEVGYVPLVTDGEQEVPLPVLDIMRIRTIHLAGMRLAFQSQSPSKSVHVVQCDIVSGKQQPSQDVKYYGIVGSVDPNIQNFYSVANDGISAKISGVDLIQARTVGALSLVTSDEQIVHYN